jgi:oxidase EvaA
MAVSLAAPACRPRQDRSLPGRLALSYRASQGEWLRTEEFDDWFAGQAATGRFRVERIPFTDLSSWAFDPVTGNLGHHGGSFFTIEGMRVTVESLAEGRSTHWHQPVINQSETGILGIVAKEFGGVLHFLMQAKMEPGTVNLLQLSPTVQATRSNYTRAHAGASVKYLEYFLDGGPGTVIVDVLQSEHGSWFHRKSNRNMIVEVHGDVPLHDNFCWLTLGQISALLHRDNLVNMDSRSVLSCLPVGTAEDWPGSGTHNRTQNQTQDRALHSDAEILSWFTGERARYKVHADLVPLAGLPDWITDDESIRRPDGRFFRVVGVSVRAATREVTSWTQPLLEPVGRGVVAFVTRSIEGVPHVLAHARVEGGFLDKVELGPTVQCVPGNYREQKDRPLFLDLVLSAGQDRIRYEALHSEEGGRLLNAESRYLVVEADESQAPLDPPPGYRWITPGQLTTLVRHGHYLNVQARTLLSCLNAMGLNAVGLNAVGLNAMGRAS